MSFNGENTTFDDVSKVRRFSSDGYRPLHRDSITSSSSSPASIRTNNPHDKGVEQKFTHEPDMSEAREVIHSKLHQKIKSSHQVGGLFDDSLQHALKINAINAGLHSKYVAQSEHAKEDTPVADVVEPFVDASEEAIGSEHKTEGNSDQADNAAGDVLRVSRSQDDVNLKNQPIKPCDSEPCIVNPCDQSQNRNVNSHTEKDSRNPSATSSTHSFYATPSSSGHTGLNETYQVVESSQGKAKDIQSHASSKDDHGGKAFLHRQLDGSNVEGMPFMIKVTHTKNQYLFTFCLMHSSAVKKNLILI